MSSQAPIEFAESDERAGEPDRRRIAWFHCFAGIAGDMALGSLLDAGADLNEVRSLLSRLQIDGWELAVEPVLRAGLSATRAIVTAHEDGVSRTLKDVVAILDAAKLPDRIHRRATEAFTRLAVTEGRIHGRDASEVHFHEVGGHDAIVDIVGTLAALEVLSIDTVESSPVAHGQGTIRSEHGLLPNPPPAVVSLLHGVPAYGRAIDLELTTPTGAVLLATLASRYGPMPAMTIEATGYGAGGRDIDGLPNCTQVVLGVSFAPTGTRDPTGQPLTLIEVNLDDATGEQVADTLEAVLAHGALDAWTTPVIMKKGRPGQIISVLCDPALADVLRQSLIAHSGSFGVRSSAVDRWAQIRKIDTVEVAGSLLRVKVSTGRSKVEHDDAAALARRLGKPVREIVALAEDAFARWRANR